MVIDYPTGAQEARLRRSGGRNLPISTPWQPIRSSGTEDFAAP